jgi:hypothetical protein
VSKNYLIANHEPGYALARQVGLADQAKLLEGLMLSLVNDNLL